MQCGKARQKAVHAEGLQDKKSQSNSGNHIWYRNDKNNILCAIETIKVFSHALVFSMY
jgi:hypothetical protein